MWQKSLVDLRSVTSVWQAGSDRDIELKVTTRLSAVCWSKFTKFWDNV